MFQKAHPEGQRARPGEQERGRLDEGVGDDPEAAERGRKMWAKMWDRVAPAIHRIVPLMRMATTTAPIVVATGSQRGISSRPLHAQRPRQAAAAAPGRSGTAVTGRPPRRRGRRGARRAAIMRRPISAMSASTESKRRRSGLVDDGHAVRRGRSTSSRSSLMRIVAEPAARWSRRRRWTVTMAPTSRPRVGWDRHHEARLGGDLAGQDEALEVAPGQEPGLGLDRGHGDRA